MLRIYKKVEEPFLVERDGARQEQQRRRQARRTLCYRARAPRRRAFLKLALLQATRQLWSAIQNGKSSLSRRRGPPKYGRGGSR